MKKHQITLLLIIIGMNYAHGQYGARAYPHPNSFLTGAKTTVLSQGFIMAGIFPYASGTTGVDFIVEKTDTLGTFAGAGSFSQAFIIPTTPNCVGGAISYNHRCKGVDIIETAANPARYALAGAFNDGVFFVTLDASGSIVGQRYWIFPGSYYTTKPAIVESSNNPGQYYICGSTIAGPYVIKVAANGGQWWARTYNSNSFELLPKDLIENGNDLIVVGRAELGGFPASEAFFLSLNAGSGTVNNLLLYSDNTGGDEWFSSIERAASTAGGSSGFIVGGWAHSNSAPNNNTWMIKLAPNGNMIWSTLINHYSDVVDVFERYNNLGTPHFEYFGLSQGGDVAGNKIMNVWKLNDFGNPYALTPNRFQYGVGLLGGTDYTSHQLDFVGNGGGVGDGLVAFSTDLTLSRHVMMKAWYNGVNGCDVTGDMAVVPGPGISLNPNCGSTTFLPCLIALTPVTGPAVHAGYCIWGPQLGGSNLRAAQLTGLEKSGKDAQELISIYPNPTNGIFTIEALDQSGTLEIKLTNSIGQLIKTIEIPAESGNQKVSVDFKELNVSEGLYFMNVTNHNYSYTKKIMYSK